eukprot:gene9633-7547_t
MTSNRARAMLGGGTRRAVTELRAMPACTRAYHKKCDRHRNHSRIAESLSVMPPSVIVASSTSMSSSFTSSSSKYGSLAKVEITSPTYAASSPKIKTALSGQQDDHSILQRSFTSSTPQRSPTSPKKKSLGRSLSIMFKNLLKSSDGRAGEEPATGPSVSPQDPQTSSTLSGASFSCPRARDTPQRPGHTPSLHPTSPAGVLKREPSLLQVTDKQGKQQPSGIRKFDSLKSLTKPKEPSRSIKLMRPALSELSSASASKSLDTAKSSLPSMTSISNPNLPLSSLKSQPSDAQAHVQARVAPDQRSGQQEGKSIILAMADTLPPKMARKKWCLDDYHVKDKMYTGYASTVYSALCKHSNEIVCLKAYKMDQLCELNKFQIYREIELHSSLKHEHVIALYGAFQEGSRVVLVQEFAEAGDLFTLLHRYGGRLPERTAVEMVLHPFLMVLQYLNMECVAHRDIKPENLLFTKNMTLKLCDFGLAIDLRKERAVTRAGTLEYMAPEVLNCPYKDRPDENKERSALYYGLGVDTWAVGILTYELLVGFPPFNSKERSKIEMKIKTEAPVFPKSMGELTCSFISASLEKDALERPTITELMRHPWVKAHKHSRSMRNLRNLAQPRESSVLNSPDPAPKEKISTTAKEGSSSSSASSVLRSHLSVI